MSVARTCRRMRIKMNNDHRYKKKDPVASARKQAARSAKEREMQQRGKK